VSLLTVLSSVKHIGYIRMGRWNSRLASIWFHTHTSVSAPDRTCCRRCSTCRPSDPRNVPRTCYCRNPLQT